MFAVTLRASLATPSLLQVELRNKDVDGKNLDYETAGILHPETKFEFSDPDIRAVDAEPARQHNVKLWLGYECSFHYAIRLDQHFAGFPARSDAGEPATEVLVRFHDPETGSVSEWTPVAW